MNTERTRKPPSDRPTPGERTPPPVERHRPLRRWSVAALIARAAAAPSNRGMRPA